jgi:hypothetical protein
VQRVEWIQHLHTRRVRTQGIVSAGATIHTYTAWFRPGAVAGPYPLDHRPVWLLPSGDGAQPPKPLGRPALGVSLRRRIKRLSHSVDQVGWRKRFGDTPPASVSLLCVSRDKKDRQQRVDFENTIGKI